MPTALLADDEAVLVDELQALLQDAWPGLVVVATARTGTEARRLIDEHRPDIAFLDIRMPGIDGLSLGTLVPADTRIVYVTAHPEHALAAFEQDAVDYLRKPVTPARLAVTVQRLQKRLHSVANEDPHFLQAWSGHTLKVVEVDQVAALWSELRYTRVLALDGAQMLLRTPLSELLARLDPAVFWQIHRGSVINARAIAGVERREDGEWRVYLRGLVATLPVSRPYRSRFRGM